jgi:hypothetical protein
MASKRRRLLNQSTHSRVASSTSSRVRHGPRRRGQVTELVADRVTHRLGAVTRQRPAVLDRLGGAETIHPRQVLQHGEPGGPLDQGADRDLSSPMIKSPPVARHSSVGHLGGTLTDHHLRSDELVAATAGGRGPRGRLAALGDDVGLTDRTASITSWKFGGVRFGCRAVERDEALVAAGPRVVDDPAQPGEVRPTQEVGSGRCRAPPRPSAAR